MSGRPTKYTPEIFGEICARLAEGQSLRAICRAGKAVHGDEFPSDAAVREWVLRDEPMGVAAQYTRARDLGLDAMAEEIIEIADTPKEGQIVKQSPEGNEVTRRDMTDHRKLQVDARKWFLSKLAPKRYGDRVNLEHSGGDAALINERLLAGRKRVGRA